MSRGGHLAKPDVERAQPVHYGVPLLDEPVHATTSSVGCPPSTTRPACRTHRGAAISIVGERETCVGRVQELRAERSPDLRVAGRTAGDHAGAALADPGGVADTVAVDVDEPAPPGVGPHSGVV